MNPLLMTDRLNLLTQPIAAKALGTLRVAVVGSSLTLAGAQKQTVYMCRALLDEGIDARFFHLGEGGYYQTVLQGLGMPLMRIYQRNRPLHILAHLSKALCRFRPQIVLAPQFGDLLHSGLAGRLCRALVIGGLRSDGFYELNEHGRRSVWMLRLAHGLIANSHRARRNLLSQVTKAPPITVLPNVLDLREFDARTHMAPPISTPADRIMAVAVGNLLPCKRFDRFLRALAQARRIAPALIGVIAGAEAGAGPELKRKAADLGLSPGHIIFLGECRNVPALLAHAGFLVLCSDYEGFPNVLLEAMAACLPVIAAPVGDAPRIVVHQATGYVVDGDNIGEMAKRMVDLAESPATRMRLGTEGRRCVMEEYDYARLPARLHSVFHNFAVHHRRHRLAENLQTSLCARPAFGAEEPPSTEFAV
jgi:glycosyltransferase involved in cell wall biosynthesis